MDISTQVNGMPASKMDLAPLNTSMVASFKENLRMIRKMEKAK